MQVEITEADEGVVITITGILKKPDAIELGDTIAKLLQKKPKKLAIDCSNLAAMSFDSVPFIVTAIERGRIGKRNVRAFGCNNVIERTLRGGGFERVGILG
ncbi:MAG: hypothetical protein C4527_22155 [Candidatus Omnitrophota bacterium]|jgi:anti-anti-sigma regulatory factor|nr:MAG: hypothetical protein C4527_22155 [Candidatus Omnitrophota bacterium]